MKQMLSIERLKDEYVRPSVTLHYFNNSDVVTASSDCIEDTWEGIPDTANFVQ